LEFQAGSWDIRVNIIFVKDENETESSLMLTAMEDHARLTITNWTQSLPGGMTEPIGFGETDGRKIVFMFQGYAIQGFKRMDISFFWEKNDV
jgi:hypothetical protein